MKARGGVTTEVGEEEEGGGVCVCVCLGWGGGGLTCYVIGTLANRPYPLTRPPVSVRFRRQ